MFINLTNKVRTMKKKDIANQVARDSATHYSEAGKGDAQRPTNQQKYEDGYERIFGKKKPLARDINEDDFILALGPCGK